VAWQEFVELLQAATAGLGGSLQVVTAPLDEYQLPPAFSLQHAAVQYSTLTSLLI
jgi:hypothetical protein